ncbi:MAG: autotransporter domain-containing protein [Pyramidobacter sp.]|nr:autotransporter domain-containing protein [Pyramidobacter sp.]
MKRTGKVFSPAVKGAALLLSAFLLAGSAASAAQDLVWSPDQSEESGDQSGSGSGGGMGGMGGSTAEWNVNRDKNWVLSSDKTTSTDFSKGDNVFFVKEKSEGDDSGFDMSGMMEMFGMGGDTVSVDKTVEPDKMTVDGGSRTFKANSDDALIKANEILLKGEYSGTSMMDMFGGGDGGEGFDMTKMMEMMSAKNDTNTFDVKVNAGKLTVEGARNVFNQPLTVDGEATLTGEKSVVEIHTEAKAKTFAMDSGRLMIGVSAGGGSMMDMMGMGGGGSTGMPGMGGGSKEETGWLTVSDSFTQKGGRVVVNGDLISADKKDAALRGESTSAKFSVTGASSVDVRNVGWLEGKDGETDERTYHVASGFAKPSDVWQATSVDSDAKGKHIDYEVITTGDGVDVRIESAARELTWTAKASNVWEADTSSEDAQVELDKNWKWTGKRGEVEDTFWNGDSVIFASGDTEGKVKLKGDLSVERMTVDGDYTFVDDASGSLTANTLEIKSGVVEFEREVEVHDGILSGGNLKLTKQLQVRNSFTQKSGSLLTIDVANNETALKGVGTGNPTLTIEEGASLYLKGAQTGNSYRVAEGFDVKSAWKDDDVSGSAYQEDDSYEIEYRVSTDDTAGAVDISVTRVEANKDPGPARHIITAGMALRNADAIGTQLQTRGIELLNRPLDPLAFANGFMPLEKGKIGGVWATPWYTHTRVDNENADMKFKNYGVTLGADKMLNRNTIGGVAVNLGNTEGSGRGEFEGNDSDGKHFGISLYGARDFGRFTLTGDIGYNWHKDDYDSTVDGKFYHARGVKSRVFTTGGTAWWNLPSRGKMSVKPFLGLRYSNFSMNGFDDEKDGKAWARVDSDSASQWLVPVGFKFDWQPMTTKSGWKIKPTAELAYVFAGGDRELSVRQTNFSGGGTGRSTQLLSDRDNFRASIGLDAKKKNVTVGLGVNTLLSSSQKDIGVNATVRVDLESGRRFGRGAHERPERELRREQKAAAKAQPAAAQERPAVAKAETPAPRKKSYSPEFKAMVVMEILAGERPLVDVCADRGLDPDLVRGWKKELLGKLTALMISQ